MSRILFFIRALLKGCYINKPSVLHFSKTSWIGKHVTVFTEAEAPVYLGEHVRIGHFSELNATGKGIKIKDFATINTGCKIIGEITIERYSLLSANIFMSSGNHQTRLFPHLLIRKQDELSKNSNVSNPIHIEEDVWIGVGVFIRQGVTIGRGAVVGANSVVLHNISPYEIYAGNPAQKKGERFNFVPKLKIDASRPEDLPYFYRGFDHISMSADSAGIRAYHECAVAIPRVPARTIIVKGFLCKDVKEAVVEIERCSTITKHRLREETFTLELTDDHLIVPDAQTTYSFINFAVKEDLVFGLYSIELIL